MTTAVPVAAAVPRADRPRELDSDRGLFRFVSASLGGLPVEFFTLQLYLFFLLSRADEHWTAIGALRPRFLLGTLTLALIGSRIVARRISAGAVFERPPGRWLAAFLGACTFSAAWAAYPALARQPFVEHAIAILTFAMIVWVARTRREVVLTVLTACFGVGAFLAVSLWEWHGGRVVIAQGVVRMAGAGSTFADPNSFGATIVLALPLMVWVTLHGRALVLRAAALLYGGLAVIAVFYTSSRSALVLGGLTALWTLWMLRGGTRLAALAMTAALAVAMVAGLSESQIERIQSLVASETYRKEESTVGRIEGYRVAYEMFRRRPLLGVGPGNWSAFRVRRIDGDPLQPHNLAGQVLATRGFAGAFAFFGFLASVFALGRREIRRRRSGTTRWDAAVADLARAVLFMLFLLLVSGLGAHNLERPSWYWAPALLVAAVAARSEELRPGRPEGGPAGGR